MARHQSTNSWASPLPSDPHFAEMQAARQAFAAAFTRWAHFQTADGIDAEAAATRHMVDGLVNFVLACRS